MRLVIDRFEENFAVLVDDDGIEYNVDRLLFKNNKEKDVIFITYSSKDTKDQEQKINKLMNKLFEDWLKKELINIYVYLFVFFNKNACIS